MFLQRSITGKLLKCPDGKLMLSCRCTSGPPSCGDCTGSPILCAWNFVSECTEYCASGSGSVNLVWDNGYQWWYGQYIPGPTTIWLRCTSDRWYIWVELPSWTEQCYAWYSGIPHDEVDITDYITCVNNIPTGTFVLDVWNPGMEVACGQVTVTLGTP